MRLRFLTFIVLGVLAMPASSQPDWYLKALTDQSPYLRDVATIYIRTHNTALQRVTHKPSEDTIEGEPLLPWDVLTLIITHSDLTWKSIATLRLVDKRFKNEVARALRGRMTYTLSSAKSLAQLMSPLSNTFLPFIGELHFGFDSNRIFPESCAQEYEAPQNHDAALVILTAVAGTHNIFDAALARVALEHWASFLNANNVNLASVHTLRVSDGEEGLSLDHVLLHVFIEFLDRDQLRLATDMLSATCLTRAFVCGPRVHRLLNAISNEAQPRLRVLHLSNIYVDSAFLVSLTTSLREGMLPNLSDLWIEGAKNSPQWPERDDNIAALTTALSPPSVTLRRLTLGSLIPLAHVLMLLKQGYFKHLEEIDASHMIVAANNVIAAFNLPRAAPQLRSILFSCLSEGPYLLAYFLQIAENAPMFRMTDFRNLVADYLQDHEHNADRNLADSLDQMEAREALRRIAELPREALPLNPELEDMATASQKILDDEEFSGTDDEDLVIPFRIDPTF